MDTIVVLYVDLIVRKIVHFPMFSHFLKLMHAFYLSCETHVEQQMSFAFQHLQCPETNLY